MDIKSHSSPYFLIAIVVVVVIVAIIAWIAWGFKIPQQPEAAAPSASTSTQNERGGVRPDG